MTGTAVGTFLVAVLVAASTAGFARAHNGVEHQVNGTAQFATMAATLTAAGNYTTLLSLLVNPVYQEALNITSGKDRTIFAPTDAAFAAVPASVTAQLSNTTFVAEVLRYHQILRYRNLTLLRTTADQGLTLQSNQGANLTFTPLADGGVAVDNVTISYPDILQDKNTAIHGISKVLIPTGPARAQLVAPEYPAASSPAPAPARSGAFRLTTSATASVAAIFLVALFALA